MKLHVATHNAHKLREIGEIFPSFEIVAETGVAVVNESTVAAP